MQTNVKNLSRPIYLSLFATVLIANTALAENTETKKNDLGIYEVDGSHQAYQGEFTQLETPQSELIIDIDTINDAGAFDLNQALDLSSSVARQNNFGGLWNSFSVRGFIGDENLPSNYLVNGFNAGRGFGGPRDLSGVESVEILKGPRAALYGRGEPGGTINLVTKRPTFEKKGELKLTAGSYNTFRTDLDWTSPVSKDVAIRIVGFKEDAESFRDTIETSKHGLNPSILYLINDQSQLSYELEYSHQEIPFDRGVRAVNGKLGVIPVTRYLGEADYGPMEADVLGHQIVFQHDFNSDWSGQIGINHRSTSLEGYGTEVGFGEPAANGDMSRRAFYRDYDATYEVIRAELSGSFETTGLEHNLIAGMDADRFENDQVMLRSGFNQIINIYNPVYGQYPISSLNLPTFHDKVEIQQSIGFYIQDQISLTDKLDIRLGARFDDYKQKFTDRRTDTTSKYSKQQISPQMGIVYKATDWLSFYATYGENFRPLSGANENNNLKPNQSKSTEVGVNFKLNDGAIIGNFAMFNVKQSNIATFDASFNPTAIGEAESKGFELDLYGNITDSLSLWLSYSHINAETKNAYTDYISWGSIPAGSPMLNVAKNQLSLQLTKQTKLLDKNLKLISGLVYVGDRSGQFGHSSFELPSYTTVRVAADYQISKSVKLNAQINNLFDEEYYSNSYAQNWVQPGAPRNFMVSLSYKF